MYSIGMFGDQLAVERHTYAPEPQRSVDVVLSILRETALEYQR
jgi:hypothetical protein